MTFGLKLNLATESYPVWSRDNINLRGTESCCLASSSCTKTLAYFKGNICESAHTVDFALNLPRERGIQEGGSTIKNLRLPELPSEGARLQRGVQERVVVLGAKNA